MSDAKPEEIAREKVERAEAGDAEAAAELGTLEETAPEAAEAAEQEAADGPAQRGVSR
jgi:hypothetical protein